MKIMVLLLTIFSTAFVSANESRIKEIFVDDDNDLFELYLLEDNTFWTSFHVYSEQTVVQYDEESKKSNLDFLHYHGNLSDSKEEVVHSLKKYQPTFSFSDQIDICFKFFFLDPDFQPGNFSVDAEEKTISYKKSENQIIQPYFLNHTLFVLETKNEKYLCLIFLAQNMQSWSSGDSLLLTKGGCALNLTNGRYIDCIPLTTETVASCNPKTITFKNSQESWNLIHSNIAPLPSANQKVHVDFFSSQISEPEDFLYIEGADFASLKGKTVHTGLLMTEDGDHYYQIWRIEE